MLGINHNAADFVIQPQRTKTELPTAPGVCCVVGAAEGATPADARIGIDVLRDGWALFSWVVGVVDGAVGDVVGNEARSPNTWHMQ